MKKTILVLLILAVSSFATAQTGEENLDTVVFASTSNYPDAFLSQPVSEKIGAPVMLTEKDQLPQKASEALQRFSVEEAVIIGGPEVVSESTEQKIASEVSSTTRLWGTTRIGTSVEVSGYFWPESEEATIIQMPVESEEFEDMAEAADESGDSPLLISKEGTLSASLLTEIKRLGASEVTVYSENYVNITQDLQEIGVEEVDIEDFETEETEAKTLFVAASGFRDALPASRGEAMIIRDQGMIQDAVETANQTEEETVYVTGEPGLASQIAQAIRQQTDKQVELLSGEPEDVSVNITSREAPEWAQEQQQKLDSWKQEVRNSPGLEEAANRSIQRAEAVVDENSSEEARQLLSEARSSYDSGDFFEARKDAMRAYSTTRSEQHSQMSREEIRERVEEEREDFREASRELRELGQEQAQELREAETKEERLEIIREYRQERRGVVEELREERREQTERRSRSGGERFRQEPGDAEEVGSSKLSVEVDGSEVKARVEYTGKSSGFTPETSVDTQGSTISFELGLNSPEGPSAQVVTDYRLERRTDVEEGNYEVEAQFTVDGEVLQTVRRQISVPSQQEFEEKTGNENEQGNESEEGQAENENVVEYTDSGFQPSTITVEQGEEVEWIDNSSRDMWVASDEHPSHTNFDGTSLNQHCEGGESDTFDQCSVGEEYEFEFDQSGEFDYHNHEFDSHGGTVVVE